MPKRKAASSPTVQRTKKPRLPPNDYTRHQSRIATAEAAAEVDDDPPFLQLVTALEAAEKQAVPKRDGNCVVYWMRMEDLRIFDNRALSQASQFAQKNNVPLVALFIHSPGDYVAHDRGARRIDFVLRNLKVLKKLFDKLHIPFATLSHTPRRTLPDKVLSLARDWRAIGVFGNIEHEVDELRRDLQVLTLLRDHNIHCTFLHDRCLVPAGTLYSKQDRPYAVYSPWLKQWTAYVHKHPEVLEEAPGPVANNPEVRTKGGPLAHLFDIEPVDVLEGWECEDAEKMAKLWPAGTEAALKILDTFVNTNSTTKELGDVDPLRVKPGTFTKGSGDKGRLDSYEGDRDRADLNSSSRISPYLAAGIIPVRALVRETMKHTDDKRMNATRGSGPGVWVMELGWRDFYTHVMAAFPRVSMGRPFQEKYANVRWETKEADLQAWKDGKTGVPIVDAAMRQLRDHGWMHNRLRMVVAMFLTKDLMIDWRLGEMHFCHLLIDHDLASNNGGWQWSASTGVDPQPYFRIFNPYLQSEKADPSGELIKHYIPELKHLKGKALYDPSKHLTKSEFQKLGYPQPIVDHMKVKERAIRRYANPGKE